EVDDELGERGVECALREGEALGRGAFDRRARHAVAKREDEVLGRVDRRHRPGPDAPSKLDRERPGPGTDVHDALSRLDAPQVGERRRQVPRVAPHEGVVRLGRDVEAGHGRNLLAVRPTADATTTGRNGLPAARAPLPPDATGYAART